MRKTLGEMVKLLLSALDSDEVNTITDTEEAMQVARIIESVYYDMIVDIQMPEHSTAFQLNASGDTAKPCIMTVPTNVTRVDEVRYDYATTASPSPDYQVIQFLPFYDFMLLQSGMDVADTTVIGSMDVSLNGETYAIMYRKDRMPQFYTSVDDDLYIFDAFDLAESNTLVKDKTLCLGNVCPAFSLTDNFTPDLDPTQFPLLINRAKVRAFNELKQQANNEAAGEARRQKIVVQKRKRKTPNQPEIMRSVRYGRK